MVSLYKIAALIIAGSCLWFCGCTFPQRTGYDRKIGDYKPVEQASSETKSDSRKSTTSRAPHQTSVEKTRKAATKKEVAKIAQKPAPQAGLESYARKWLGTPYLYGASSTTSTDCSGFVMQVYNGYYNIALDHSAASMYKDSRGSSVSRGSLKEGDLVFFGSFWKIDHVGIYLSGDRFIHASSSKGVIISPMNDKYWSPKYQGARRFR